MTRSRLVTWGIPVIAAALAACGERSRPPADAAEAALGVERSRVCAEELERAVAAEPDAVAQALAVEPVRLAPFVPGSRAEPLREVIAQRLEDARANAAAAQALETIAPEDRAGPTLKERVARSVAASTGLCRSAERLRRERLARVR